MEESAEKAARYVNGLRMDIQDEINMISPRTMEEAYQCALRVEEMIAREKNFNRGQGSTRGRGHATRRGIFGVHRGEFSNSNQQEKHGRGGDSRRRGPYQGGRGRERGRGIVCRCYKCNQLGYRSFECLGKEYVG